MQVSKSALAAAMAFAVFLSPAAQTPSAQPRLEVLPTADSLGPGWVRHISFLFDSAGSPTEAFESEIPPPDEFKKKHRERVNDPTGAFSATAHVHFDRVSPNGTVLCRYEMGLTRYRSKERLVEGFDKLMSLNPSEYSSTVVDNLGDAAVVWRRKGERGFTLWLRRADFKVWIDPMSAAINLQQDTNLVKLANNLDALLAGGTNKPSLRIQGQRRQESQR